jgi:HEAT repeat protein
MLERQCVSNRTQLTALALAALCVLGAGSGVAARAGDAVPTPAVPADDGRTSEAGIDPMRHQPGNPGALRARSRAVMARAMGSEDAFHRWAGLRAARALSDPALVEPARAQLHSNSRYEEALALEILARNDPEGSRTDFVAALDSPYRTIRIRALRALQPNPDDTVAARLAVVAADDTDPDVRVLAIRTLKQWNARSTVASLRRGLTDSVAAVQQETVKALVALGDREVSATVLERVAQAPPEERVAALRLASLVPSQPAALDAVSPYLDDPNPEVRVAAAAALLILTPAEPKQ